MILSKNFSLTRYDGLLDQNPSSPRAYKKTIDFSAKWVLMAECFARKILIQMNLKLNESITTYMTASSKGRISCCMVYCNKIVLALSDSSQFHSLAFYIYKKNHRHTITNIRTSQSPNLKRQQLNWNCNFFS